MLNVTACDYINKKLYPDFRRSHEKVVVEKPPFAQQIPPQQKVVNAVPDATLEKIKTANIEIPTKETLYNRTRKDISIEKIRDIADSTQQPDSNFTVNPIALNNEKEINSNKPKVEKLFDASIPTTEERFVRFENRMQIISDTINKMSPSITRLIGIENDLGSLTFQLEELIKKGTFDNAQKEKNAPVNTVSHSTVPSGNRYHGDSLIPKIRVGDHKGKTRIVFETKGKIDYDVDIDNKNKIMTISFPEGSLGVTPARYAYASYLIKTIKQNKVENGSVLEFKLNKPTSILKNFYLAPDKKVSNQRIVIDLKR